MDEFRGMKLINVDDERGILFYLTPNGSLLTWEVDPSSTVVTAALEALGLNRTAR